MFPVFGCRPCPAAFTPQMTIWLQRSVYSAAPVVPGVGFSGAFASVESTFDMMFRGVLIVGVIRPSGHTGPCRLFCTDWVAICASYRNHWKENVPRALLNFNVAPFAIEFVSTGSTNSPHSCVSAGPDPGGGPACFALTFFT